MHLEKGKTLYITLLSISEPGIDGYRTVFFDLKGHLRDVRVGDQSAGVIEKKNIKADRKASIIWVFQFPEEWCRSWLIPAMLLNRAIHSLYLKRCRWNRVLQGANVVMKGTGTSTSGEEFKVFEIDKLGSDNVISINWNLIGDEGTHYIVRGTMDLTTWAWISIDKAVCPGRK